MIPKEPTPKKRVANPWIPKEHGRQARYMRRSPGEFVIDPETGRGEIVGRGEWMLEEPACVRLQREADARLRRIKEARMPPANARMPQD